jgi:hypothetical protein
MRAIGAETPAGTEIAFSVEMKDLISANTLAGSSSIAAGRRYERWSASGRRRRARPVGSIVVRHPGKAGGSPPPRGAPAAPIGVGIAPTAIKSNLARASSYVKSQAALNLTTRTPPVSTAAADGRLRFADALVAASPGEKP